MSRLLLPPAHWDQSHQCTSLGPAAVLGDLVTPHTWLVGLHIQRLCVPWHPRRVQSQDVGAAPSPGGAPAGPAWPWVPFLTCLRVGAGVTYNPASCLYALHLFAIYYL